MADEDFILDGNAPTDEVWFDTLRCRRFRRSSELRRKFLFYGVANLAFVQVDELGHKIFGFRVEFQSALR